MKNILSKILFSVLFISSCVQAQSFSYEAVTDFETIDAGEVPYYKDARNVLAINAANDHYREKYARASTTFNNEDGQYDITIDALGEVDGECIYRFLVNGEIKGSAVNKRTEIDYAVQSHVFQNIQLSLGDTISVESMALSNGLIPENDEFAFARGRWKTLTITENTITPPPSIDLSLSQNNAEQILAINNSLVFEFEVKNNSSLTATNPQLSSTLPQGLSFLSSADCQSDNEQVVCQLAEINAGETQLVSFELLATTEGTKTLQAIISADQFDSNLDNNNTSISITTKDIAPASPQETPEPEGSSAGANTIWLYLGMIGVFALSRRKKR